MSNQAMNRRNFLRKSALFVGATTLAACQPKVVKETVIVEKAVEVEKVVKETVMVAGTPQVVEKIVKQTVVVEVPAEPEKAMEASVVRWMGPFVPPYRFDWLQNELLAMWKDVEPNVEIDMEQTSSWPDTEEKVLVRFAGGGGPDLVQTGETGAVTEFAYRKIYASMNAFMEADPDVGPELFFTAPLKAGQFEGETYALPQDAICDAFFYNKAYFEKAGIAEPPMNHAEIAEYAKILTELDEVDYGLQSTGGGWNGYTDYFYSNGGKYLDDACSRVYLGDEISVETLRYVVGLVEDGYATPHGASASFSNGKCAMVTSVPGIVGWTMNYAPDIYENLGSVIMPRGKSSNTVWGWAHYESILANSKNKEAAWAFLVWMLSEDIDLVYHDNLNFLPCQPRTYAKPPFNENPSWITFGEQLKRTKTMPLCVSWREISMDALAPELEAAWIGVKSPKQAMEDAGAKAREILG